jgi:hypothetical protein
MSKRKEKARFLTMQLKEDGKEIPVLGYMTWWSLRDVDLTRDRFIAILEECGLNKAYAREHNYRSAFKRALKSLEEKRIIRFVDETPFRLVYQFTKELKREDTATPRLEYDRETLIVIDKEIYRQSEKFEDALVEGIPDIKKALIALFYQEKTRYNSGDVTRYIQRIFEDEADIITLRDQGCLYFVPAAYREVLDKVSRLVRQISGNDRAFEFVPLPDTSSGRVLVKRSIEDETQMTYEVLAAEIETAMKSKQEVSEVWKTTRISRILGLQERLATYAELLGDKGKVLVREAQSLEKEILKFRKLDLG